MRKELVPLKHTGPILHLCPTIQPLPYHSCPLNRSHLTPVPHNTTSTLPLVLSTGPIYTCSQQYNLYPTNLVLSTGPILDLCPTIQPLPYHLCPLNRSHLRPAPNNTTSPLPLMPSQLKPSSRFGPHKSFVLLQILDVKKKRLSHTLGLKSI